MRPRPFSTIPTLRRLLKDVKAAADIRIDTISTDAVISSGWDEKKATDTVERFKRFLESGATNSPPCKSSIGCPMRNGG